MAVAVLSGVVFSVRVGVLPVVVLVEFWSVTGENRVFCWASEAETSKVVSVLSVFGLSVLLAQLAASRAIMTRRQKTRKLRGSRFMGV